MARKRIGEMLVEAGLLGADGLRRALVEQRRWGGQIGSILIDLKLVSEEALVAALSRQLNFPVVKLDEVDIPEEVLNLVSSDLAEQSSTIPFNVDGKFLDVAMSDPTNLGIIDELRIRTQLNVRTYLAGPKAIERALSRFYGLPSGVLGLSFQPDDLDAGGPFLHTDDFDIELDELDEVAEARPGDDDETGERGHPLGDPRARAAQEREQEIRALQDRLSMLESLVTRDEDVIRKLLGLLVDKGIATREEILERIK